MNAVDVERLREVLAYDPDTGIFIRRMCHKVTGSPDPYGYLRIHVCGHRYLAHRLAWLYVHGVWPQGDLDHIDENPSNNRISNLRLATIQQNQHNKSKLQSNNTSGYRGVSYRKGRWRANIKIDGHNKHLGHFDTPEQAHEAYLAAKFVVHPFWSGAK